MYGSQVALGPSVTHYLSDASWGWPLDLLSMVAICLPESSLKQEPVFWEGK